MGTQRSDDSKTDDFFKENFLGEYLDPQKEKTEREESKPVKNWTI
jgi:hypothetical protein